VTTYRLNPAEDDYQIRKRFSGIGTVFKMVERTVSDTHTPGDAGTPETPPPAGFTYSVEIDPTNPHLVIVTSDAFTGSEHSVDVPISTLFVPDPTNPHLLVLPTLST
jgi:hypothetical protein